MKEKIHITAPIKVERKSKNREKAVASVIEFPENKQPDLLYFSAILVSSGENLNHAYFLPSELVKAEHTIVNKAVDREHIEDEVIGHIYDRFYLTKDGEPLHLEELASKDYKDLDTDDMDIAIAGIIYKNRFPTEAEEVKKGEWCISMEAYFTDFDLKIGDVMIPRKEAEALGLTAETIGKAAEVYENNKVVAEGSVARVLRNIIFAGCGIVKNPANPDSVFLEAANLQKDDDETEPVSLVNIEDKIRTGDIKIEVSEEDQVDEKAEERLTVTAPETTNQTQGPGGSDYDTVSQCVHFQRYMDDNEGNRIHEDWCVAYDTKCTSALRQQSDPECLYYKELRRESQAMVNSILAEMDINNEARLEKLKILKTELEALIEDAKKKCGTSKKKKSKKKSEKKGW